MSYKGTSVPTLKLNPPAAPHLSSVKAVNHYLANHRVRFNVSGSNLALKAQAFFLSQPSFRADHQVVLA